jgi:ubiquinol-cytochrome c reductase cytochrome b subunit
MSVMNDKTLRTWTTTTTGIVAVLLVVQFVSGVLLAFYYVPSVDHAHQSVAFIEKVVSSGSWLRSLHHYGSQWLSLFVFLHVIQLFLNRAYEESRLQWTIAVLLLALIMAGGATGYSLPWDARAFFSTRIGEGLLGGLPLVGQPARLWLLGGADISTLTLSRLFALHVLITPFFILAIVMWRLYRQGDVCEWESCRVELWRQSLVGGVVFLALAIWTATHHAALGPAVHEAAAEYLPRPGAQYLWLYQSLKYLPGSVGSLFGLLVPGMVIVVLLFLPRFKSSRGRIIGGTLLGVTALLVVSMTTLAYVADRNDPRTRAQLQKQQAEEQAFRTVPFVPTVISSKTPLAVGGPPPLYVQWCANCHGVNGQGATQGTLRFPALIGVGTKPRRSVDDIVGLLLDPPAYGIEPPMTSFKSKLSSAQMHEIAEWVVTLK